MMRYWRALLRKRSMDLVKEIRSASEDRASIRSAAEVGSKGWLVERERRYAPVRDRGRGATSVVAPKARLLNSGGDKMSASRNGYAEAYAALLAPWVGSGPTLVELGVFKGTSLAIWCDLFPSGRVIGMDVELERFRRNVPRLRRRGAFVAAEPVALEFDAFQPDTGALVDALAGRRIDIFIDDGPHEPSAQIAVARAIAPLLATDALYIIEDVTGEAPSGLEGIMPTRRIRRVGGLVVVSP